MKWWQNGLTTACGVLIAAHTSSGIAYQNYVTLAVVVVVITFLNMVLKPILVLFTLPFIIFTFGLGLVFINALLLKLTGFLIQGFEVASWGSAIWAALVVSITSLFANALFGEKRTRVSVNMGTQRGPSNTRREVIPDKDVIDI